MIIFDIKTNSKFKTSLQLVEKHGFLLHFTLKIELHTYQNMFKSFKLFTKILPKIKYISNIKKSKYKNKTLTIILLI